MRRQKPPARAGSTKEFISRTLRKIDYVSNGPRVIPRGISWVERGRRPRSCLTTDNFDSLRLLRAGSMIGATHRRCSHRWTAPRNDATRARAKHTYAAPYARRNTLATPRRLDKSRLYTGTTCSRLGRPRSWLCMLRLGRRAARSADFPLRAPCTHNRGDLYGEHEEAKGLISRRRASDVARHARSLRG